MPPARIHWRSPPFVLDEFSSGCEKIKERPFLHTGVRPAVGQRIELKVSLPNNKLCFLSGEVTEVRDAPTLKKWRPSTHESDCGPGRGSTVLSEILLFNCKGITASSIELDKFAIGRGLKAKTMEPVPDLQKHAPNRCTYGSMDKMWTRLPKKEKDRVHKYALDSFGALHGQEVVCEAR